MPFDGTGFQVNAKSTTRPQHQWKNQVATRRGAFHGKLLWPTRHAAWRSSMKVLRRARPNDLLRTMEGVKVRKREIRRLTQVRWTI
jgi:hypothetical protein